MSVQSGLNIVTLVMCIITLAMATAALMPQIKLGLVILRDGLLWATLLGVVGFVGFVGWSRLLESPRTPLSASFEVDAKPIFSRESESSAEPDAPDHSPDAVLSHSFGADAPPSNAIGRQSSQSRQLVPVRVKRYDAQLR